MFDGAAVLDVAHAAADASAKALIPVVMAPVEVRAADPSKDNGKKEVVFIDTSVTGYKTLEDAAKPGIAIEEIDAGQSGLAQMAKWAETNSGFDSISVISHGANGTLQIGTDTIIDAVLPAPVIQAELAEIGHALKAGGDFLLYGCDIAKGTDGQQFIADLATATGADVAASTDTTGAADQGGNWTLEAATGVISATAFDGKGWNDVLGWTAVGTASGISQYDVIGESIAIAPDGTPYLAYCDGATNYAPRVMKFSGGSWADIGNLPGYIGAYCYPVSLAIAPDGTPYLALADGTAGQKTSVVKFDGTHWSYVGTRGFTPGSSFEESLVFSANGTPYLAETTGNHVASVMWFDGSSWYSLGGGGWYNPTPSPISAGYSATDSLAIAPDGTLYLAYQDAANANKATVVKFAGGNWVTVGTVGFTAGTAAYTSLAIAADGTPYLAFEDGANANKASVAKFTGGNWVTVGTAGFSAGVAAQESLVIDSYGAPTLAFQDGANANKASVMTFDGTNWISVGAAGLSDGATYFKSIHLAQALDGRLYLSYADDSHGDKAVVEVFGSAAPILTSIHNDINFSNHTITASTANFTVAFNKAVSGVNANDFVLTYGGTAAGGVMSVTSGSSGSSTYTVHVTGLTGEGTVRLDLQAGAHNGTGGSSIITATSGGVALYGGAYTKGQTYTLDHIAPSITGVSIVAGNYYVGSTVNVTISIANDSGGYNLTGGTVGGYALGLYSKTDTAVTAQFTVSSKGFELAPGGTVAVAGLVLKDAAGNASDAWANAALATSGVAIDSNVPTAITIGGQADATHASCALTAGSLVGALSVTDASTIGDTLLFRLYQGADKFEVINGQLRVKTGITLTNGTVYTLEISVQDLNGIGNYYYYKPYSITGVAGYIPNLAPAFVSAATTITVNANSIANNVTSLLTVGDVDIGQTETWHQYTAPSHGTISLGSGDVTKASGGSSLSPASNITYTPTAGYAGTDTFTVTVGDGKSTVTRTVTVTVTPVAPGAPVLAAIVDTGTLGDNKTNATTLKFGGIGAAHGTSATDGSDVLVFLDVNGNGVYDAATDRLATTGANTAGIWTSALVNAAGIADGTYNVYAWDRSLIGSVAGPLSAALALTIDRTAPTLASTTPSDNATLVAISTSALTMTFSEAVIAGTGNFVLHDITTNTDVATIAAGSGSITGWGGTTLSITLSATLLGSHHYSLRVAATAVQDVAGNAFAGIANDVTMDFTTADTPPVFTSGSSSFTVAKNASALNISSILAVGDADTSQTETWSIASGGAPDHGGTLTFTTATSASGAGTLTPTATYRPNAGFTGTETFTVQVSDGTATATRTITVTVDALPVVTTASASDAYTEQAAAVPVDSGIVITDADNSGNGNWSGGSLKIQISANSFASDSLGLPTSGGGIVFSGGNVYRDGSSGTVIGTTSASSVAGSAVMTIAFNSNAVSTDVQAVASAVTFADSAVDPTGATRTVTFTATDGSGATYNGSGARQIAVTLMNDAPTLAAVAASGAIYVEKASAGAQLFTAATVSAVEASQSIQQLTMTVGNLADGANEVLVIDGTAVSLTDGNSVTTLSHSYVAAVSVAVNVATVTITRTGNFTASAAQTLITGLAYKDTSNDPTTAGGRTVTLTSIKDSGGTVPGVDTSAATIASTVGITTLNDAPTLTSTGASPVYIPAGIAVALFGGTAISTVEAGQKVSQLVFTVSNLSDGANEIVVIDGSDVALTNGNAVTTSGGGSYAVTAAVNGSNLATVTITKVGGITATAAQSLIDGISYKDTLGTPTSTNGVRVATLTSITDDGANGGGNVNSSSVSVASTITVLAFVPVPNAQGTITVAGAQAYTTTAQHSVTGISVADATVGGVVTAVVGDTSGHLHFTKAGGANIADNDGTSVTITGSLADVNSVLDSLTYTPTLTVDGTDTITVNFNDGAKAPTITGGAMAADQQSIAVTLTANAAPTVAAASGFTDFSVADNTLTSVNGLTLADSDIGGGDLKLTLGAGHGTLSLADTTGLTLASGTNGSAAMVYTGTLTSINAALTVLGYTSTLYFNGADTITATINDQQSALIGGAKSVTSTITATVTHTDIISIVSVPGSQSFGDTSAHGLAVSIADVDVGGATVTVAVSDNHGGFLHVGTSGGASISAGANNSAAVSVQGTLTQVNSALAGLTYAATQAGSEIISFSVTDNSGYAAAKTGTGSIAVTVGTNDAPSVTAPTVVSVADKSAHSIAALAGSAISIADSYNASSLSVTVSDNIGGLLSIDTSGVTLTAGANASSSLTFTGSVAQINAALAALTYTATYDTLANSSETISVAVNDGYTAGIGGALTGVGATTVTLTANDTPVVSVTGVGVQSFGTTAQQIIPGVSVTDSLGGSVTVTVSDLKGLLNFTAANGDADASTNVTIGTNDTNTVTITGTLGDVNATLGTLKYTTIATTTGTDTVTVAVNDGGTNRIGGARNDSKTFDITLTANDTPVLTLPATGPSFSDINWHDVAGVSFADTNSGTVTAIVSDLHGTLRMTATGGGIIDNGNATNTVQISGTVAAVNATLATLQYKTDVAATGVETINVSINDGNSTAVGGAKTASGSFLVAMVGNDTPVVTAPVFALVVGDNQQYTAAGFAFTDTYSGASVVATLSSLHGTQHLTASNAAILGNNDTGTVTITGTGTDVLNTLATFTYGVVGSVVSDSITVSVNDGNTIGVGGSKTGAASLAVIIKPNDTPVLAPDAGKTFRCDVSGGAVPGFSFTDTYVGATVTATIAAQSGGVSLAGSGVVVSNNGSNLVTVTGAAADVNAALSAMTYRSGIRTAGSDILTVTINDNNTNGVGGALHTTRTTNITLTALPDIPAAAPAPKDTPVAVIKESVPVPAKVADVTMARIEVGDSAAKAIGMQTVVREVTPTRISSSEGLAVLSARSSTEAGSMVATSRGATVPSVAFASTLSAPSEGGFRVSVASDSGRLGSEPIVVSKPIGEVVQVGKVVFGIPSDAFAVTKADAQVTLRATQADGSPLPGWLTFNPTTGQLEGTPPPGQTVDIQIKVTARDKTGGDAAQVFKLTVKPAQGADAGGGNRHAFAGKAGLTEQIRAAKSDPGRFAAMANAARLMARGQAA